MTSSPVTVIAIDGPSASGKSTVAKAVADVLQYNYVDTGAMYRAFTWKCLKEKADVADTDAISGLLKAIDLKVDIKEGKSRIIIDGIDPAPFIRSEEVSALVSPISAIPAVRERMVAEQRALARFGNMVMEGRDIGTVVFPDTYFKFFLDAAPQVRARRRAAELQAGNEQIQVARSLEQRDLQDSTRSASPLRVADDAVRIDTSDKSISAVVDLIIKNIRTRHLQNSASREA